MCLLHLRSLKENTAKRGAGIHSKVFNYDSTDYPKRTNFTEFIPSVLQYNSIISILVSSFRVTSPKLFKKRKVVAQSAQVVRIPSADAFSEALLSSSP